MQIFISILLSLIIGYCWIRMIDRAFHHRKIKLHISLKTSIHSALLVLILLWYQYILHFLWKEKLLFLTQPSIANILLFITYCILAIIVLITIHKTRTQKTLIKTIITNSIGFTIVAIWGYYLGVSIVIMFILISAYAEEYLKFNTWENIFNSEKNTFPTDLILFSMLIGLGFSGIENAIAWLSNIFSTHTNEIAPHILTTWRGLVSTIIHIVSTGIIAYITILFQQNTSKTDTKHKTRPILIAFIVGVSIHTSYNLAIQFQYKTILVFIIIWGYFALSFLLFKSDRLYTPPKPSSWDPKLE